MKLFRRLKRGRQAGAGAGGTARGGAAGGSACRGRVQTPFVLSLSLSLSSSLSLSPSGSLSLSLLSFVLCFVFVKNSGRCQLTGHICGVSWGRSLSLPRSAGTCATGAAPKCGQQAASQRMHSVVASVSSQHPRVITVLTVPEQCAEQCADCEGLFSALNQLSVALRRSPSLSSVLSGVPFTATLSVAATRERRGKTGKK